jgi:hypothetical protein
MFDPPVMAGTILFSTEAGRGDEGAFDPRVKRCHPLQEFELVRF